MKIGFKAMEPVPPVRVHQRFKSRREPEPEPVKFGFRKGRSLWSAIVDRDYSAKPNNMDGSCASRAVPPGETPTLLKSMGYKEDVGAPEYCDLMDAYAAGKFTGTGAYQTYRAARGQVGKLGHVAYSWKTWRD